MTEECLDRKLPMANLTLYRDGEMSPQDREWTVAGVESQDIGEVERKWNGQSCSILLRPAPLRLDTSPKTITPALVGGRRGMRSVLEIIKPALANRRDNPCLFQVADQCTFAVWGYQKGRALQSEENMSSFCICQSCGSWICGDDSGSVSG
jgi:hypothetical protein